MEIVAPDDQDLDLFQRTNSSIMFSQAEFSLTSIFQTSQTSHIIDCNHPEIRPLHECSVFSAYFLASVNDII